MATPETTQNTETPATEEPNENQLLANILGLIKPEEKDVRPPVEEKKVEPAPVVAAAPEPKKVAVRKREPAPAPTIPDAKIEEVVKRTIAAQPVRLPDPVKPVVAPDPELRQEQREELDLARYAESKDPAKKGLSDKLLKFYENEKKFLEKRVADEGDEYDPSTDPAYRKFIAANAPTFDRKNVVTQKITEEAETRATKRVREELAPEQERVRQELVELKERPKVQARVNTYVDEVASGMPGEVYDFYRKNGGDMAKTQEAFPLEFDIIAKTVDGVLRVADEFLSIRAGLKQFDPKNQQHTYVNEFVDERARVFLDKGGDALKRGGKQFVHPYQWKPGMENTHWTFDDEDVLNMLKVRAQFEAKTRISNENARLKAITDAQKRRTAAPISAAPVKEETTSPKVNSAPSLGGASNSATGGDMLLSQILGFAPKSAA